MKKNKLKIKDVPNEVMYVWAIQYTKQPIGMTIRNEINDIINRNPQYFIWEHKYKEIPQEVHSAYSNECYHERQNNYDKDKMKQTKKVEYNSINSTKDIMNFFDDMEKLTKEQEKEKIMYKKNLIKIWDKHYSKYGLEYRDNF